MGGRYSAGISQLDVHRPLIDQPARARRAHEARIRWSLAGPVADRLYFPSSGYRRTPQPVEPPTLPDLSPAAAAQLINLEQAGNKAKPGTFVHDEDAALHYCFVLVGSDLSLPYYQWAQADTRAMVAEHSATISRLAETLQARGAMSAQDARAVIRGKVA